MSFESLTIPVEPEKCNTSQISIPPVEKSEAVLRKIHGNYQWTTLKAKDKIIFDHKLHPVFEGFVWAYRNHRPITISPDIIWLLIAQAFSNHVNANAESLRRKFVNFSGQKELVVERLDFNVNTITSEQWQEFFPEFSKKISEYTGKDIIDALTPNFTTTTPVSLAVGQLTIMATMKEYFKYRCVMMGCGFPFITIEGSAQDWRKILEKLEGLEKYDFKWFTSEIIPIIQEILNTKEGNVNTEFWKRMLRIKDGRGFYDPGYIDGWFARFFPFDDELRVHSNSGRVYEKTELQKEIQVIPFTLEILPSRATFPMEFLAGFVGLTQNEETGSIKPEIGWFIRPKAEAQSEDSE